MSTSKIIIMFLQYGGIFALIIIMIAWPLIKLVSSSVMGRIILMTGSLLVSIASLAFSVCHIFRVMNYHQYAMTFLALGKYFAILGTIGILTGILEFMPKPKLCEAYLKRVPLYKKAAFLCLLAVIVTFCWPLSSKDNRFNSIPQQDVIESVSLHLGLLFVALEIVVLWFLSKRPIYATRVFESKIWFLGILPASILGMTLLYMPIWLYVYHLQGFLTAYFVRTCLWFGLMIIGHGLFATFIWYAVYPYVVETAIDHSY